MLRTFRSNAPAVAAALLCVGVAPTATAATFCVATVSDLAAAMTTVQTNDQDNYIRIVDGSYTLTASLSAYSPHNHTLSIEGGYVAGCASPPFAVADFTIINGASGLSMQVTNESGPLYLRNLTLQGFKPPAGTDAIRVLAGGTQETLRIENLMLTGNGVNGINDSILSVHPQGGLAFDDNVIQGNSPAFAALKVYANYPGAAVTIANNTIVNNQGTGLALEVYAMTPLLLANNILWNNFGADLIVTNTNSSEPPFAFANVWLNCTGCASLSPASTANSSSDPKLLSNFRLDASSPAINAGVSLPVVLPALDAGGVARVVGSAPDKGAYETSTDDLGAAHTYTVVSTGDDASNILTLRGAITAANAAKVPARISVNLSLGGGGCPQIIPLATPLPPITVPMVIDGYADSSASPNSAGETGEGAQPFNATICPILANTATPPVTALSTGVAASPNFHVEVRGLAFVGFATGIDLTRGIGNWIHGDQFGRHLIFGPVGNGTGVLVEGGFADVIGGWDRADVNLISVSSGPGGVTVSGGGGINDNRLHTITNNSIGGDTSGLGSTFGNAYNGVELIDTQQQSVINNYIVANGNDGVHVDDSSFNLVRANRIGLPAIGNGGAGIHALFHSSQNWFGNTDPVSPDVGNIIQGNAGAGVWIDYDAGASNEAVKNVILGNGGYSIDLSFAGWTANGGAEDSGPNDLLHKPQLLGAVAGAAATVKVTGSFTTAFGNDTRYLSLYAGGHCNDMLQSLGTYTLKSDPTGLLDFTIIAPAPVAGLSPAYITATDEDYSAGATNVSEQSNAKIVMPSDDIWYDEFEGCP